MAMVTHRPEEKIANVVSFVEGYPLKEGSEVALDIGGTKFDLFTKDDSAWARTAELDKTIVAALAKGKAGRRQGDTAEGPGDHRHLCARRLRPGAGADRQGLRRQALAARASNPSTPVSGVIPAKITRARRSPLDAHCGRDARALYVPHAA